MERYSKDKSLSQTVLCARYNLPLPIRTGRESRRFRPHFLQHLGLAHPTDPAVHLEVHAHVRVQVVLANEKFQSRHCR